MSLSLEKIFYDTSLMKEDTVLEHVFKYWKPYNILSILIIERPRENYRHLTITTRNNFMNYGFIDKFTPGIKPESCLSMGFLVRKHSKSSWEIFFSQ